jgi:hypothetical protein
VKEEVEERPKVIEVKVAEERTEVEPKAVEAEKPKVAEKLLRLEEEELEEEPEIKVRGPEPTITEPVEEKTVEELAVEPEEAKMAEEEESEMIEEEMPMATEPEPAPKGPPIPSSLPYRGSLCPAGRSATLGRVPFFEKERKNERWVVGVRQGGDGNSPQGIRSPPEAGRAERSSGLRRKSRRKKGQKRRLKRERLKARGCLRLPPLQQEGGSSSGTSW